MAEIGFQSKPFTPHMTIFRIRRGRNLKLGRSSRSILSKYNDKTFGDDIVNKVHLKRSDLTPAGPIYSDMFTVNAK
jgi:2'-5' RNA ligase